jgi:hypothetical protein
VDVLFLFAIGALYAVTRLLIGAFTRLGGNP